MTTECPARSSGSALRYMISHLIQSREELDHSWVPSGRPCLIAYKKNSICGKVICMLKGILRVRERFTVTLTREIRKALGIKVGQRLEAIVQDDRIILRPLPEDPSKLSSEILREARMHLNQIKETALSEAERD